MKVGGASGARWDKLLRQAELEAGRTATPRELENQDAVRAGGNVYFVDKARQGEPTEGDLANKTAVVDDKTGKAFWVDQKRTDAAESARQSELSTLQGELPSEVSARQQLAVELEQFSDGVDQRFQSAYVQGMNPGLDKASGAGRLPGQFDVGELDGRVTARDLDGLALEPHEIVSELDNATLALRAGDFEKAGIAFGEAPPHPSELSGGDLARWQRVQLTKADSEGQAAFLMNPASHPRTSTEKATPGKAAADKATADKVARLALQNEMLEHANEMKKFLAALKGQWAQETRSQLTSGLMKSGKLGLSEIHGLMAAVGMK